MRSLGALALVSLVSATPAFAADPAVNVGVLEIAALPGAQHLGVYPYLAASIVFANDVAVLIPSLGIECSPELGAWGLVGAFTADFPVGKIVGIDLVLTLVHDQLGLEFDDAAFYLGLGAGASFLWDEWTLSPSVSVFRGLNVDGWSLVPAFNLARAF